MLGVLEGWAKGGDRWLGTKPAGDPSQPNTCFPRHCPCRAQGQMSLGACSETGHIAQCLSRDLESDCLAALWGLFVSEDLLDLHFLEWKR